MSLLRMSRRMVSRVHHTHYPGCGCEQMASAALRHGAAAVAVSATPVANHAWRRGFATDSKQPIGFIGLGHMGGHMAHNLLKAGHPLVVFDLNQQALDRVQQQAKALNLTARVAKTPQDVGLQVPTLITMLPSSPHVRQVYTGPDGVFKGLKEKDSLLIDSSTIDPQTARDVAQMAGDLGAVMVDAPVSGGVGGAEAGTLTFMVGGSEAAFKRAQPILSKMGKNIVHCGGAGTGQVAKVCNNVVLGMSMAAVAEGMSLGVKLGMDPKKLAGIFNTSSARCWSSEVYNPCPGVMENVPASRGYSGGFGTALMHKDMGLATDAAKAIGHEMALAKLTQKIYSDVMKSGNADKDFGYVYEYIKNLKTDA